MARPIKNGLDYFPLDVDFFEDDKIQLIAAEFGGVKAECLIIRLLCKIYRNGYYYQWGNDQCLLMCKSMGTVDCSKEWIQEVVQGLVRRCFFDKGCFDEFEILTSSAIQRRYIEAIKGRKLSEDRPFWLLSSDETPLIGVSPPETIVNPPETPVNPQETTQRKEKESKVNKIKEKESREEELSDTAHPFLKIYNSFLDKIKTDAPRVLQMKEPFTFNQFVQMYEFMMLARKDEKKRHKLMTEVVVEMHNKANLFDNISAYVTFQKFMNVKLKQDAQK